MQNAQTSLTVPTTPAAPVQPAPVSPPPQPNTNFVSLPEDTRYSSTSDGAFNNDGFIPTVGTVDDYYDQKLYEHDKEFMQSRIFDDEVPSRDRAKRVMRHAGLVSYVTSDLSPERAQQAYTAFGRTSPYRGDNYSHMLVGRAICANANCTGDPVSFIRNYGEAMLGITMPQQGVSSENELYTLIGSSFAKKERDAYTKLKQQQEAKAKELEKRRQEILPRALTGIATRNSISPEERAVLTECGISSDTIWRVRMLTGKKGQPVVDQEGIVSDAGDAALEGISLMGIEGGSVGKATSLFETQGLYEAAGIIGDDKIARLIYLNLVRIAGRRHRDSHNSENLLENAWLSLGNFTGSVTRSLSEGFIKSGTTIGMNIANYDGEHSIQLQQYEALRADAEEAFKKGYKQRDAELAAKYGSSTLWQIADFPTTIADLAAGTAPWLNPYTMTTELGKIFVDERNAARSNALEEGDYNASFTETTIVPALKSGITGAAIFVTGKASEKLLGAVGNTSLGRAVSSRISTSPSLAFAGRALEGIVTEPIEEAVTAIGIEAVEASGIVKERQKEENWTEFTKLFADSKFWGGNIGMNLVFAGFGYKGSRSKYPYKFFLKDLGFTEAEQKAISAELTDAYKQGADAAALGEIVQKHILEKQAADPEAFKEKASTVVANVKEQLLLREAAANGVRNAILKEAKISDMVKNDDGTYNVRRVTRGKDGKFEVQEERYTEEQLNTWLASDVQNIITQEILDTQKLVRGEQLSRTAEKAADSPFSRVISLLNAPPELITKLDGKTTFDEATLTLFSEYAIEEINTRLASGQSLEEAKNAEFGTTGTTLGAVANLSADFQKRVAIARAKGQLKEDEIAQTNAYILPGKTPGDNILMLARGEASAKDVAHDWLEGFARTRFYENKEYWKNALDALDADLLNNGIIQKSLFDNAQGHRSDLDYIEAFSHLAEANFLAAHGVLNLSDDSHSLLDEVLDDLGAVQGGLELATQLKNYLNSDSAASAIGNAIDPLRSILNNAGAALTDLIESAQKSSPQSAADFILHHRESVGQDTRTRLESIAQEASAPLTTTSVNPQQEAIPADITDGQPVTVAEMAQLNGIDPATGTIPTPANATYTRTDPKKNGRSLVGGIAHGQPDGSICGAAKLSDISVHPAIGADTIANTRPNPDEKEVILFRKKDGSLQAIGGLSLLNHATACNVQNVPVRVYSSGKKYTPQWAAKTAAESKIRAGIATTQDILSHILKNKLTRDAALRQNLVPKDNDGKELATSRAAWLLRNYASKKTIAATISGKLPLSDALLSISPKLTKKAIDSNTLTVPQNIDPNASIFKDGKYSHASESEPDVLTGSVAISSITHSPEVQQFKRTRSGRKAGKSGVVNAIPGTYKTHAPIHLWHRTDGSLVVISGRHRLQKAIEAGATHIPATVFPENSTRNAQWANVHDFEQNVMDNQASVADIAHYVQGFNPYGRKLTQEETEQFNRQDSNAEKGLYIGLHGSQDLIYSLGVGVVSPEYAYKISKAFPDDANTQQQAIAALMDNKGIQEAIESAQIYKTLRDQQSQELSFGESEKQEAFNRFFAQYAANKIREIGRKKSKHNITKTDKSIREHEKVGIHVDNPEQNRKELQRLTIEQDKWRNPGLHPECRQEAEEAFNKSEDAAQSYLNLDFSNTQTSSFSITPARARRKYLPLSEAYKLPQYIAMQDYANKLYRDARALAVSHNKNKLDNAVLTAMQLRSLLNAIFATLPKDSQPWKALQYAKKNIDSLTWATANPYADLTSHIAPSLTNAEIDKYNNSGWKDRRIWLTNKLSKLVVSVADSAARSIEAHACRVLLQSAEDTIKTLLPKHQKSGKERRGTTSADVFQKAIDFYDMFDWGVDKRADALTEISAILNDPATSPHDYNEAVKRRNAILLFAGLNRENLTRVQTGVQTLLTFISTGKEEWNTKLTQERREIEAVQEAIASLEPQIDHSATTAKETRKHGKIRNFLSSFLNPVQTLKTLAALPGKAGEYFNTLRDQLATAQDNKTYAIRQAHLDAENALDTILGNTGKSAISRDLARADFLTKANELKKTGIIKPGRIKITTFQFTQDNITNLINIKNTQSTDAFNAAIDQYRKRYSTEDKLNDTIPYDEVFNDALSQIQSPEYRGGTIYVEHYGQRDTEHSEELELTKLQAANLWLLGQQPSYANKYDTNGNLIERGMLDTLGYTEDILNQLEQYCGKELIQYAIWKREYLNTTGLFEAYEQYMGLPFPKEENYWPGAFDTPTANGGLDAFNTTYEGSGVYSMLITRKKHLNEPNLSIDIEAAWEHAIQQHFHYIHLSPITRTIRNITRNPDTRARLRKISGRVTLDNLDVGVNALDGAPAMQLQASIHANGLFSRIFGSFAKALLNMATATTVKQVSAIGHALDHPKINLLNIGPKLLGSLLSEIKGVKIGHVTPSEIRKLPAFQVRKNRENLTRKASQLKPGETQGKLALFEVIGGRFLEYSDYWANSIAMATVYNTEYDHAKKLILASSGNKTLTPQQETQLRQHCENTVATTLKQTAQPLEREDKPAFLQQQNWAQAQNAFMLGEVLSKVAGAVTICKAELSTAYGKSALEKRKSRWRAAFKTYKYIGGMSLASQSILALLSFTLGSAPDTDDEEFTNWLLSQALAGLLCFGYLTPLPIIGESVGGFGQSLFGQYGAFATYANSGIGASYKDLQDIQKACNADKGTSERIYAGSNSLRWGAALLNFCLGGTKYGNTIAEIFNAANNLNNAARPALQYAKNAEKKETKRKKAIKKLLKKPRGTKKVHTDTLDY